MVLRGFRYVALTLSRCSYLILFSRGKFAAVRRVTHKVTGVAYAAKFIRKRRRSMDQRQEILHEVAVLCLAESAHRIVNLLEVYETPTEMALVLELAAGGELQRVVDLQDGLEEVEAVRIMHQVLDAIGYLHSHNIAHLDLKPQNMLLTTAYPDTDLKLCDFGISRLIREGIEVREILGTPDYVAPEILSYEPISLATDMWSVGVLAYVLLSGYSPFAGDTKQQTFCNISQCILTFPDELFEGISPAAIHFIQSTLVVDPRCRLNAAECLNHPWLTGMALLVERPLCLSPSVDPGALPAEGGDSEDSLPPSPPPPYGTPRLGPCLPPCSQHDSIIVSSPVVDIIHDRGIIC
ncbi:hypothetical protein AAG570_009512 [Ranatra chinensis]|uniref:non-specific serine/threonine protein kinase n=1 Tax=Ranatra chinensis TaxID=642074 RepID=A0ABD0YPC8_9HEMI